MNLRQKYGNTALVAGASEGIGAAYATCLAAEGMDLILIARRLQPLQQLADFLENKYKVKVKCISGDLSGTNITEYIEENLNNLEINLLVYNAALSYIGPFIKNPVENHIQAAQVNILTPMKMVYFFGGKMLEKGKGAIILMTSMAALQGSGYLSFYAASKAFNRILAESLWYEWKKGGVDVIACCAGATSTPGYKNTLPDKTGPFTPRVLDPEEVAQECLKRLGKDPSLYHREGKQTGIVFYAKNSSQENSYKYNGRYDQEDVQIVSLEFGMGKDKRQKTKVKRQK